MSISKRLNNQKTTRNDKKQQESCSKTTRTNKITTRILPPDQKNFLSVATGPSAGQRQPCGVPHRQWYFGNSFKALHTVIANNWKKKTLWIEDKETRKKVLHTQKMTQSRYLVFLASGYKKIFYMTPRVACWCRFRHWSTTNQVRNQPPRCDRSRCPSASN